MSRGQIFYEFGDTPFANNDFRKAVEINPNLSEGWYQLARLVYMDSNSDSIGIIFITRAIKSNTENWKYYLLRGDILIARHNYKSALIDYEKGIGLLKNNINKNTYDLASAYTAIGGTLIDMSQLETKDEIKDNILKKAIENLEQAIKFDSLFGNAYLLLGNAFFLQKNYEESIDAYESCLKINPTDPDILTNLAIAYREGGQYFGQQKNDISKALMYLDKSYQLNQKDLETLRLLGVANGMNGDAKIALNWFIKASELDPNNASVWWNLGLAYGFLGNEKKMKKCRKTALRIDPDIEKMK